VQTNNPDKKLRLFMAFSILIHAPDEGDQDVNECFFCKQFCMFFQVQSGKNIAKPYSLRYTPKTPTDPLHRSEQRVLAQADMDTSLVMGLLMTAKRGELPIDFTDWHLANKNGFTVAHAAALYGRLPPTFTQWDFASQDGWTVAHLAARAGHLPADFAQWELKDNDGWTVAHVAAGSGYLHQDFDRWHLADNKGWTVAHEAASRVMLPESFEAWGLTDDQGKTVALIVVSSFRYPQDSPVRQMAQAWIDANAVDSPVNISASNHEEEGPRPVGLRLQQSHKLSFG
jgi:hypothetical protein